MSLSTDLRTFAYNQLLSQAGLLKVPEELFNKIWEDIKKEYSGKVKYHLAGLIGRQNYIARNKENFVKALKDNKPAIKGLDWIMVHGVFDTLDSLSPTLKFKFASPDIPNHYHFFLRLEGKAISRPLNYKKNDEMWRKNIDSTDPNLNKYDIDFTGWGLNFHNKDINYEQLESIFDQIKLEYQNFKTFLTDIAMSDIIQRSELNVERQLLLKELSSYPEMPSIRKTMSFNGLEEYNISNLAVVLWLNKNDVKQTRSYRKEPWAGLFFHSTDKVANIWLYANPELETVIDYRNELANLKTTLRHELQHLFQVNTKNNKDLKENRGLPSNKIRNFDDKELKKNPANPRITHSLRDLEFFTNLSDQIEIFNTKWNNAPDEVRSQAAKIFVGIPEKEMMYEEYSRIYRDRMHRSDFFITLLNKAPEKWKKACKEFFIATDTI